MFDSVNHTRSLKEDHLPDCASRDNQVKKGDRVACVSERNWTRTDNGISSHVAVNTFAAGYLKNQRLNNSCLKSPASTLVDLTFQSRALRSFSLNQLCNLSL